MSSATLQTPQTQQPPRAASAQGHRQYLRSSNPSNTRSASHPHPSRQNEKDTVIKHIDAVRQKEVLAAEQISEDPVNKQLGLSSQHLRLTDFELMRTLGTGTLNLNLFSASGIELILSNLQVHLLEYGSAVSRTQACRIVIKFLP